MSVMDFFRTAKQPEPMQGSVQQQEAAKKAADEAAAAAALKATQEPKAPESPLDKFSTVFTMDDSKAQEGPQFNIDPTKLVEQAKKTNFVSSVTPEILARIEAGGKDGVTAMMETVNNVAQGGYAQSTLVAAKLVEAALKEQQKHFENVVIPQVVKQASTQAQLSELNPALNHPAIAPVMAAVQDSLAKQHPTATPKELSAMAQDFVSAFANAVNPPKDAPANKGKGSETDWSAFLP